MATPIQYPEIEVDDIKLFLIETLFALLVCSAGSSRLLRIEKKTKKASIYTNAFSCTPGGIRTPSLLIRSQKLYPVELRAHFMDKKIELFVHYINNNLNCGAHLEGVDKFVKGLAPVIDRFYWADSFEEPGALGCFGDGGQQRIVR